MIIITILLLIIYSFCMGSKLNDLITNICCNSETCLPTNKLLSKIYHLGMTKSSGVLSGSWNSFIWITAKDLQNDGTINSIFFNYQLISLISPLSILVPNKFWPSNSGCALYALVCFTIEAVIS